MSASAPAPAWPPKYPSRIALTSRSHGISTGAPVVLRAAMKPISTLREPLGSVEMGTHRRVESRFERSDVCAVPAVGIVLEAVVALELADAALDRFGGATVGDLVAAVGAYRRRIGER